MQVNLIDCSPVSSLHPLISYKYNTSSVLSSQNTNHPLSKLFSHHFLLFTPLLALLFPMATAENSNLFREYIGAQDKGVQFTDVPINPDVEFHFILAFAIDYTTSNPPSPTDGEFNVFWDTVNLTPSAVASIKQSNSNVKVALSLGGSIVGDNIPVTFHPTSMDSWVNNAVSSLTSIIQQYDLDGIDIDYENFISSANPDTFAECIGRLITTLKNNGVIQFASIAPYEDEPLQTYYEALWAKYSDVIDYVNFQFYGYPSDTTVSQFLGYFDTQSSNYEGGNILTSLISDDSEGLTPENGFFDACKTLQDQGRLFGIFIWSADSSKAKGFPYEVQAQDLLADA